MPLIHLGSISIAPRGLVVAAGLLGGLLSASLLGPRAGVSADRLWNLAICALLTFFLGERLLIIALNLRDFIAHPVWMLGLTVVRDERYFLGGALLAICAGAGYVSAWRLPWRSVGVALAPGVALALWAAQMSSFLEQSDGSHLHGYGAARYGAVFVLGGAAIAAWLVLRTGQPGKAAAFLLFCAGLQSVLLEQLRYRVPDEFLLGDCFTTLQVFGILAVGVACILWLEPAATRGAR